MPDSSRKKPITNAHAHAFTHRFVPPFLARTIVPWPFYYLVHVPTFVRLYIWINELKANRFKTDNKRRQRMFNLLKRKVSQNPVLKIIYILVLVWLAITAFFILYHFLGTYIKPEQNKVSEFITAAEGVLKKGYVLFDRPQWLPYWLVVAFAFTIVLGVKPVRKVVLFLLNTVWRFLHLLPGKQTKELFQRYLMMARFALYKDQSGVFTRLRRQYPLGTEFVLLPMDMKYMGAGSLGKDGSYELQMQALRKINDRGGVHAFVFVDPRRIREEGKAFLDFELDGAGGVNLKKSFVHTYMEEAGFAGFKIYPALGYFPFDEDLLPLWKYAADRGIPIMAHGVKGIIYYRGRILPEWNEHPVFMEQLGKEEQPLLFDQFKNVDFQENFTHPMNYLCLLEEPLLRRLIGKGKSEFNKTLFGYVNDETPLKYDLSTLKVCFAHFGGSEEWQRFAERDRDNYAQQLMAKPDTGIEFQVPEDGKVPWGRYESVWKSTDWYSICCSMMIQYPNFYSDISYIVSNLDMYPMLKSTLGTAESFENKFTGKLTYASREKLRKRVLFGSDFYVVRSQRADKDIFTELKAYLSEEEFDLIARDNPAEYLKRMG